MDSRSRYSTAPFDVAIPRNGSPDAMHSAIFSAIQLLPRFGAPASTVSPAGIRLLMMMGGRSMVRPYRLAAE